MAQGRFITFEGGEGSGKSTQARRLAQALRERGLDVLLTREPGGSPFAERVRALILDPAVPPHSALAEALLFYAARADHLSAVIEPALRAGRWVISDRFSDSTRVYQSLAGDLPMAQFETLERLVVGDRRPGLTLILDVPPAAGLARAAGRRARSSCADTEGGGADAYERRDIAFHERLRAGFLAIASAEPARCVVIDGTRGEDAIAAEVLAVATSRRGLG